MPTVAITETEINPTYIAEGGGGRKTVTETEINPTYKYDLGMMITETEINPTFLLPKDTQTMGRNKGFDFRGKGLRI